MGWGLQQHGWLLPPENLLYYFRLLVKVAKHKGKGRNFSRYLKGRVEVKMSVGTLAAVTGKVQVFDDTVTTEMRVSSLEATYSLETFVAASGDGPLHVGIAHSDYDLAEIEQWIESTTGWDEGDLIGKEIMQRKIRQIGTFRGLDNTSSIVVLNDGRPIKTKLNWLLTEGDTLDLWIYNAGSGAIGGDPALNCSGHVNLWGV